MSYKRSSGKVWTGILAVLLVIVIIGVVAGVGILSDGFKDWSRFETEQEQPTDDDTADNGGMIVDTEEGSRITLKATTISVEEYADYGVSAQAESAQLLTATVLPENAVYENPTWTGAWQNAGSEWASGKTSSDYFTVTVQENTLTATVQCLQAFAEVGIITFSVENGGETYSCTATLNYAQRIDTSSIEVKLGTLGTIYDGSAPDENEVLVRLALDPEEQGEGGLLELSFEGTDVYTVEHEFSYSFGLGYSADSDGVIMPDLLSVYTGLRFNAAVSPPGNMHYYAYELETSGLYFGLSFFADNLGLQFSQGDSHAVNLYSVFDSERDEAYYADWFNRVFAEYDFDNSSKDNFGGELDRTVLVLSVRIYSSDVLQSAPEYFEHTFDINFVQDISTSYVADVSLDDSDIVF